MRRLLACSLALGALALPSAAAAQGNYRGTPVGGRTTLMGSAGLVYGSDGAAAFMNPATVQRVDPGRLTFSVNFYSLQLWSSPRWYEPAEVDRARFGDFARSGAALTNASFDALPSSLCFFLKAGDIEAFARKAAIELRDRGARFGLCFATVQGHDFAFAAGNHSATGSNSSTRQGQTVNESYTRFYIGPTYSMNIDDHLAIGASVHASLASHRSLYASTTTTFGPGPSPVSTSFYAASRGTSFQATASLGATYRFGQQSIGLALEAPSLHVYGVAGANRSTHYEGTEDASSVLIAEGSFRSRSPARIGLGTGIERSWGSAELDFSAWLPMGSAFEADLEGTRVRIEDGKVTDVPVSLQTSARTKGVVNVAAGAEVYLNPRVSVLGGAGTDFSAVPKGGVTRGVVTYLPVRRDRVYASFGVGSHGEGGDLLVGTELSWAVGERLAVANYQLPPELASTTFGAFSALFVVAGSTSFYAIKRAVRDVREVLETKKPVDTPKPGEPKR